MLWLIGEGGIVLVCNVMIVGIVNDNLLVIVGWVFVVVVFLLYVVI